jgi:serine/threonine-protein kinase
MPTAAGAATAPAPASRVGRLISSDSIPVGGFAPGNILADRYRIIGLLGRGGMGEVYRADDLKLGQPVALKFLPKALASDPVRRERFFAEVRITRQLAHPNICRVYDVTEFEGQHFLSMEYIDGEDLAALIKRIGYLTNEKALDIARQLAAGLAAAHERGVLHRDLKPANIMIDGHGRVRITDFGLAVVGEDETAETQTFGTPAYMAPEQFAGKAATTRSDIYALGLILYELYSGKRAFTALTIAELREQKSGYAPTAPSETRSDVDPVVERLIMRCLERDPRSRPASVAQMALALPGGDPLAAAIAASETPSPEMVAASGLKEGLRPAVAVGMLAWVIAGLVVGIALVQGSERQRLQPDKSPAVLVERAREFLRQAGYPASFNDSAFGFSWEPSPFVPQRTGALNPASSLNVFWYRESPFALNPIVRIFGPFELFAAVSRTNPPLQFPGEIQVLLDMQGRLIWLRAIPPPDKGALRSSDWAALLTAAGQDMSKWTPTDPRRNPFLRRFASGMARLVCRTSGHSGSNRSGDGGGTAGQL